jgi:hypothetical protein
MRKSTFRAAALALAAAGLVGAIGASEASANGNGNGEAVGRPAPGTVGNADDKAPGGQGAGDANKGYECDDNHGVGRGNPAHTGCTTTSSSTPPNTGSN